MFGLFAYAAGATVAPHTAAEDCGFVFTDASASAGIDFVHDSGSSGGLHLPETMGAGVAWLDFDGDGWLDLYFVQSGPFPPPTGDRVLDAAADRLFRNLGPDASGRFRFAPTTNVGMLSRGYGQGVVVADVDGDRDADLLVSHYGPTLLFRNDGAGRFADAEPFLVAAAGRGPDRHPWGSSLALADADADGDLDLYVTRYLDYAPEHALDCRRDGPGSEPEVCDPSLFLGQQDRFYLNRGDGRFEDRTAAAGLGDADGKGLGVVFTDLDGDGRPDLYVANDLTLNLMFRNRGDGTFEDVSLFSGTAVNRHGRPEAGMGVAVGDVDGDGDPDLMVTNFDVETNTLYLMAGAGGRHGAELLFEDVSATTGFGQPSLNLLGFGIVSADFDLDGALDVYVANGHIFAEPRRDNTEYRQRNLLLAGGVRGRAGGGRELFAEVRCRFTDDDPRVSRGLAVADFDLDGDADLAVSANGGPARLWRNDAPSPALSDWLGLELRGRSPNTEAVGAVATLSDDSERLLARRWVIRGDSYQSSSGHRLRWAAPAAGGTLQLDLRWPSGHRTRIVDPPVGAYAVVQERP